jgi:uncharacterized cupin superfamily protein
VPLDCGEEELVRFVGDGLKLLADWFTGSNSGRKDPPGPLAEDPAATEQWPPGELPGWTWRSIRGESTFTMLTAQQSADWQMLSGRLQISPGRFHVTCHVPIHLSVIEGDVVLSAEDQPKRTLTAGVSMSLAPGFDALWENDTSVVIDFDATLRD